MPARAVQRQYNRQRQYRCTLMGEAEALLFGCKCSAERYAKACKGRAKIVESNDDRWAASGCITGRVCAAVMSWGLQLPDLPHSFLPILL
jgi:hypothetical protein